MSPFYPPPRTPGELKKENILVGGSTDPKKNVALSNVLKKARAGGVPKANIESALQKVTKKKVLKEDTLETFSADMDIL